MTAVQLIRLARNFKRSKLTACVPHMRALRRARCAAPAGFKRAYELAEGTNLTGGWKYYAVSVYEYNEATGKAKEVYKLASSHKSLEAAELAIKALNSKECK